MRGCGKREGVLAHHEADLVVGVARQIVDERERIREAFGVRVVRAEDHAVRAELVAELREVVLVVRRDPHVVAHLLHRVHPVVRNRHLAERLLQRAQQERNPVRAALDRRDAQVRVPGEHAVAHERGDRVVDRPVTAGHGAERVVAERLEVAAGTPLVGVAAVARVAGVVGGEDAGLGEARPHRVVDRVAG